MSIEEISVALQDAVRRGDLAEVAALLTHRGGLISSLAGVSDPAALERMRAAGERLATLLRELRARDLSAAERLRQVSTTVSGALSQATFDCVG